MEDKKNKKRQVAIIISSVLLVMVLMVSITYAYFTARATSEAQTITTGNLGLAFNDNTAILRATNISPLVREEAIPSTEDNLLDETNAKATVKTFSITNSGTEKLFVDIKLEYIKLGKLDDEGNPTNILKRYDFMYALYEEGKNVSNGSFEYVEEGHKIMEYLVFEAGETKEYQLCIWIEETNLDQSLMMNEEFSAKITATGSAYWVSNEDDFGFDPDTGTIIEYIGSDTSISIPSTINGIQVTKIDEWAFYDLSISKVIIPNSITSIGESAFDLNQLTSVVIPNSVTDIGAFAFDTNQLTSIILPNSVTYIGGYAFSNNQLTSVVIPNSITEISASVFDNNQLTSIIIPNSVTTIGNTAFVNNQLTNLVIPNSVTTIEFTAFHHNQLTTVTIPSSVTTIGSNVFNGNSNLVTIILKGRTEIPEGFANMWYDDSVTTIIYQ